MNTIQVQSTIIIFYRLYEYEYEYELIKPKGNIQLFH